MQRADIAFTARPGNEILRCTKSHPPRSSPSIIRGKQYSNYNEVQCRSATVSPVENTDMSRFQRNELEMCLHLRGEMKEKGVKSMVIRKNKTTDAQQHPSFIPALKQHRNLLRFTCR
jgi:hypothetical protein